MTRRRGFSLTEVVVVLVIILIASSVALSAYTGFSKYSALESSARQISRTLLFAKQGAITRRNDMVVYFDIDRQTYWVDEEDASLGTTFRKVVEPKKLEVGVKIQDVQVGALTQSNGTITARFAPSGENPLVEVTMRREMDSALDPKNFYTVQLYPASDEARILERERR